MIIRNKLYFLIPAIIMAYAIPVQTADGPVQFMGDYINVSSATGEHCEGYDVMIWEYKGSLIGFLNHHRGLCGDPPMGVMEETVYSAHTGSLSFRAKLSDGCTYEVGKCIPTRDRIEFKGNLRGETLEGVLTWFRDRGTEPASREKITLLKEPGSAGMQNFETYADWMKYWKPIFRQRGPKW